MSAPWAMSASTSTQRLAGVAPVLLVALAIAAADDRHVDGVAERPVQPARVLGRVGEDRHVGVARRRRARRGSRRPGRPSSRSARRRGRRPWPGRRRPWRRSRAWRRCRRRRRSSSTPQWPWSVYSSTHRSAITHHVVADVGAQVGERELHDAVRVERPRADGVLDGRDAEQDHGPHAEVGQLGDLLAQALAGVLHDAGQRHDRLRLVDALADEQRGDRGRSRATWRLGDEVTQRRRAAQAARPIDGEGSTGHRRHGMTRASRSDTEDASGDVATWATRSPRAAASDAVTGPMATIIGGRPCVEGVGQRGGGRAAGQHHGIGARQHRHLLGRRAAGDRAVGDDGLHGVAAPDEPVGQRAPGPVGLGEQDSRRLRRELGEQPLGAGLGGHEVDVATGGRGQRGGRWRGRPPPGAAQGGAAAAGPARAAPLADVTTSQSNAASRASAAPQLHAAVDRVADLDQRHVHHRRPQLGQAGPELAGLRPA